MGVVAAERESISPMSGSTSRKKKGKGESNESISVAGISIPVPPPRDASRRPCKFAGKRTKLQFGEFVHNVLEANERLAMAGKKPLTNSQIEDAIRDEFSEYPDLIKRLTEREYRPGRLRTRYNGGKLKTVGGSYVKPTLVSFCYDEEGKPVEPRFGVRELTYRERWERAKQIGIEDERMQGWLDAETRHENQTARRQARTHKGQKPIVGVTH
jgi:hypothetical protein